MLPISLHTNIIWNNESKPDFAKSPRGYESVKGERVFEEVKKKEKRIKLSLLTGDDNEEEGDDETNSVVSFSEPALLDKTSTIEWPFEETAQKLEVAAYQIRQLYEVLQTPELGTVRIERPIQSKLEKEQSLKLGLTKRAETFNKVKDIFKKGIINIEKELKTQRKYMNTLSDISTKWGIISPYHGQMTKTTLKPEEPLAVNIEIGNDSLVLLNRTEEGIKLSSFGKPEGDGDEFKPYAIVVKLISTTPPYKAKGIASGGGKTEFNPLFPEQDCLKRIQAKFRDAHARDLFKKVFSEIKLGKSDILKFELQPETSKFLLTNKFDGICALALNLLERGKSSDVIQVACLQKLIFPTFSEILSKTPGIAAITWTHDEDDEDKPENLQSRCCIDVGRSGRYALEFVLCKGELSFDWTTIPGFHPNITRMLEPEEALLMATQASRTGYVKDLVEMVKAVRRLHPNSTIGKITGDSFQVSDKENLLFSVIVSNNENFIFVKVQYPNGNEHDISRDPFFLLRRIAEKM